MTHCRDPSGRVFLKYIHDGEEIDRVKKVRRAPSKFLCDFFLFPTELPVTDMICTILTTHEAKHARELKNFLARYCIE